jgi:YVTN family beta-propeller protein
MVIDPQQMTVIDTIVVGPNPVSLCHPTGTAKLYAANSGDSSVSVIDLASREVVTTIPLASAPEKLIDAPGSGKVYCAGSAPQLDAIAVDADSIVATVSLERKATALCHNPQVRKLYAGYTHWKIHVIDTDTDSVLASVSPQWLFGGALACNRTGNSTYLVESHQYFGTQLEIIDGVADTVVRYLELARIPWPDFMYASPISDRLYLTGGWENNVAILSGTADTVLGYTWVGAAPKTATVNPYNHLVYVTSPSSGTLWLLPDSGDVGIAGPALREPMPRCEPTPTICRGVLLLPSDLSVLPSDFALMDISGRRVMDLHPGSNDIRHLSPGIYFIREESARTTRKVIVTK